MRQLRLWAALLTLAAFLLPAALALPAPPLCRVTATYTPLWWGTSLGRLTVTLDPACPPDGVAFIRLGQYGGPGSRATGPTETLSPARPVITWTAQPRHRTVLWVSQSGRTYTVPTREVRAYAPEDQ